MLGMKTYSPAYIAACRQRVDAGVKTYQTQVIKATSKEFKARYFIDQILLLDHMFLHRLMGVEGKDGNPLNEVRVLCNSILFNQAKRQIDKLPGWPNSAGAAITLSSEKSVLKLKVADDIKISKGDFVGLAKAFFLRLRRSIRKRKGTAV